MASWLVIFLGIVHNNPETLQTIPRIEYRSRSAKLYAYRFLYKLVYAGIVLSTRINLTFAKNARVVALVSLLREHALYWQRIFSKKHRLLIGDFPSA
jgi:hypothetical protein